MKIIITIALLLAAVHLQAQMTLLGKSKAYVLQTIKEDPDAKLITHVLASDGSPWILYMEGDTGLSFGFRNDTCVEYKVMYPRQYFKEIIQIIDSQNLNIDQFTWVTRNARYKIVVGADNKMFWLIYTQLQ